MPEIWVPRPKSGPMFDCFVCGATLYEDEYEKHVAKCSSEHHEELRDLRNHVADRLPGPADPQFEQWVKDNAQAIIENRKRM